MKKKTVKTKKPVERHKILFKLISENLGKGDSEYLAIGNAMRKLGYSESYASNPQQLTGTESWEQLMKIYLPDDLLAKKHKELLEAKELAYFVFPKKMRDEEIEGKVNAAGLEVVVIRESEKGKMAFYSIDNTRAKKDALDMAFKLKSKYAPEEVNMKFKGFSKEQLIDLIVSKITNKKK